MLVHSNKPSLAIRLMALGAFCSSAFISSVFLAYGLHDYLTKLENGHIISMAVFSALVLLSTVGLLLFSRNRGEASKRSREFGFNILVIQWLTQYGPHFAEGFLSGLSEPRKKTNRGSTLGTPTPNERSGGQMARGKLRGQGPLPPLGRDSYLQ